MLWSVLVITLINHLNFVESLFLFYRLMEWSASGIDVLKLMFVGEYKVFDNDATKGLCFWFVSMLCGWHYSVFSSIVWNFVIYPHCCDWKDYRCSGLENSTKRHVCITFSEGGLLSGTSSHLPNPLHLHWTSPVVNSVLVPERGRLENTLFRC